MSNTSPDPSEPLRSLEYSGAVLLCVLCMLNHVVLTGGRIAVSLAALGMGLSTFMVGLLMAMFAFLPMLLSVRAGRLIDRIGVGRPLQVGTALVSAGAVMPFIWPAQVTLMMAAVGIGIGFMFYQVATQNLLGQAEPEARLRNFSTMSLILSMSGFGGPLLAGLSIDHLGHRYAFGLLTLAPVLSAGGLFLLWRRLPQPAAESKRPAIPPRLADLLATPALRRVLMANVVLAAAWDTHTFLVPIFGVSIGLTATTIGLVLAAFAGATFVIRLALPVIQRHVRPWSLITFAMFGAGAAYMLYPWFTDVAILTMISFGMGLALGASQPSILALLHQHAPQGRAAEAVGLRAAMVNGSQVTLPLAAGAVATAVGVAPIFGACALALAAGGWTTRKVSNATKKPRRAASPE